MKLPTTSVCMITYGHKEYIAQAIESVLMQDALSDLELVIGDDCSQDGTSEIVSAYAAAHPGKIRARINDKNMGIKANFVTTLKECRGKYIALLEGDDVWIDPTKIRRQVQTLEQDPSLSLVAHKAQTVVDGEPTTDVVPTIAAGVYGLLDILKCNFIPTCTVMFRQAVLDDLPEWYSTIVVGDWPLHVLNAQRGRLLLAPEVAAQRRCHSGGAWCGAVPLRQTQMMSEVLRALAAHLKGPERALAQTVLAHTWWQHIRSLEQAGESAAARQAWIKGAIACKGRQLPMDMLKMAVRLYAPFIHGLYEAALRRTAD